MDFLARADDDLSGQATDSCSINDTTPNANDSTSNAVIVVGSATSDPQTSSSPTAGQSHSAATSHAATNDSTDNSVTAGSVTCLPSAVTTGTSEAAGDNATTQATPIEHIDRKGHHQDAAFDRSLSSVINNMEANWEEYGAIITEMKELRACGGGIALRQKPLSDALARYVIKNTSGRGLEKEMKFWSTRKLDG
jgi:hypothetical protein